MQIKLLAQHGSWDFTICMSKLVTELDQERWSCASYIICSYYYKTTEKKN
jgi:hypothetical protein